MFHGTEAENAVKSMEQKRKVYKKSQDKNHENHENPETECLKEKGGYGTIPLFTAWDRVCV